MLFGGTSGIPMTGTFPATCVTCLSRDHPMTCKYEQYRCRGGKSSGRESWLCLPGRPASSILAAVLST